MRQLLRSYFFLRLQVRLLQQKTFLFLLFYPAVPEQRLLFLNKPHFYKYYYSTSLQIFQPQAAAGRRAGSVDAAPKIAGQV